VFYDSCAQIDLPPIAVHDNEGSSDRRGATGIVVAQWRSVFWWSSLPAWMLGCFLLDLGIGIGALGAGIVGLSAQLAGHHCTRRTPTS
jgi:hypothetical protein